VIHRLEVAAELPSTQAALLARTAEPDGLALLAHRQTEGRGRDGRDWSSPPGNLHLSVLWKPDLPVAAAPHFALLAAVALHAALVPHAPAGLALKWPNDVLIGQAKLAGILVEAAGDAAGRIGWMVLGFGVNLAHAPLRPDRPTACLGAGAPTPEAFAASLLASLATWRARYLAEGLAPVRAVWLGAGPPLGSPIRLRDGRAGSFAGLSPEGALLLEAAGAMHKIASGEVT
jgi:BirA family biotin operon repressor/biotin-[acetyl-CoA-carboxylase] ligase